MLIKLAYKTELNPNNVQRTMLLKTCGAARFAYNWGLQRKLEVYHMNQLPIPHIKNPTSIDLHKELNKLKKTDYPWLYDVSKCAPQEALRNLDEAFENFFKNHMGYPNFKSKRKGIGSFTISFGTKLSDNYVYLPRIGKIRLKERGYLPIDNHILSVTVSEKAGCWFVSVTVDEDIKIPKNNGDIVDGDIVGIDMGCSDRLCTTSEGMIFNNPRALRTNERKLKRLHRELSRRVKGSKNRNKTRMKLAKLENRIANIRKDNRHKTTTMLAKTKSIIGVESLNIDGMKQNPKLAKSISDAGMGEFLRQLKYKSVWYGCKIVEADRFFPSSKKCSRCGNIKHDLKLSDRIYNCDNCGLIIDRDLNASYNLREVAVSLTENENACLRREVSGIRPVLVNDTGIEHKPTDVPIGICKFQGTEVRVMRPIDAKYYHARHSISEDVERMTKKDMAKIRAKHEEKTDG